MMKKRLPQTLFGQICLPLFLAAGLASCTPTVAVKAPEKPLEINLNVKVDHNITVKVDKQLEEVMSNNEDIF